MTLGQDAVGRHGANQDEWELDQLVSLFTRIGNPKTVLEIGCDRGGTLWLWRQLGARVVAITLHTRADGSFNAHGAEVVIGNSLARQSWDQANILLGGHAPSMVFVDGGHDYETSCSDIHNGLLVAPEGIVVVHDINRNLRHPEIETYMAWLEFADERPSMTISRRGSGTPGIGILFPKILGADSE